MHEVFPGSEAEVDDHYEVTAFCDLDFEADEVTELIEVDLSSPVASSAPRLSFMPSLFRAL